MRLSSTTAVFAVLSSPALAQFWGGYPASKTYEFATAICLQGTPSAALTLPASGYAAAVCVAGTNTTFGALEFGASLRKAAQEHLRLPDAWSGRLAVTLKWYATPTTGAVYWGLRWACAGAGAAPDPAWLAATTATATVSGTASAIVHTTISTFTLTGCAAGQEAFFEVYRDGTNAADTLAGTASLLSLYINTR